MVPKFVDPPLPEKQDLSPFPLNLALDYLANEYSRRGTVPISESRSSEIGSCHFLSPGTLALGSSHCANGKPKKSVKRRDPRGGGTDALSLWPRLNTPVPGCPPRERAVLEPPVQPVQPAVQSSSQLPPLDPTQIEGI